MSVFNTLYSQLLDLLFPTFCVNCQADGQLLCTRCRNRLILTPQMVAVDGVSRTLVAADYQQHVVQVCIKEFKYHNAPQLAEPLARLLIQALELEPTLPDFYLLPVALHKKRQRQRGYNQSELLAQELHKKFNWPLIDGLTRTINTSHQAKLSRGQRLDNLQGAFRYKGESLKGKNILLIDDVVTTGATLREIALTLHTSETASIWALVLARNQTNDLT